MPTSDTFDHRVILNGLTNALKFCKSGPITVSLSASDDVLVAQVQDAGAGFDEKTLPYLLQPFTKGNSHSPGAGLGLHITKRLLSQLGGSFILRSQPGQGTTFQVTIPAKFLKPDPPPTTERTVETIKEIILDSSTLASPAESLSVAEHSEQFGHGPPMRILVVDDNMICRRILNKNLKRHSVPIATREADNGLTALNIFPSFRPDLVLTDVSMPVMDGVTSARHMRLISREKGIPHCKIYAITGLGVSDPRLKAAGLRGKAGLDGWLVKGQDDIASINRIISDLWNSRGGVSS